MARLREVLEHAHLNKALAALITVPDPESCRILVHLCKTLSGDTRVRQGALSRDAVGPDPFRAEAVVSKEDHVGTRLADEMLAAIHGENLPEGNG